jgi:fucose permease
MAGMIMLGIVGGIIIGWVTGKIREAVLNKQNRIF